MKVRCLHGYFILDETRAGQISAWSSLTGLSLTRVGDRYTFAQLETAPRYSLKGKSLLLGITATENFEGEPWEVFEANGLVYNFNTGKLVPIASVSQTIKLDLAGNWYISNGLILPGSVTVDGKRVKDYSAWLSGSRWFYSEVTFV